MTFPEVDPCRAEKIRAKLAWEAAVEKLGNALEPPLTGLPQRTPKSLLECFESMQARLDEVRAAYGVDPRRS